MPEIEESLIGYALTSRIVIYFEGIFQDRLATDPDPSNEKRGVVGWTFAHTGEPDLDRIIRFNHPVAERAVANSVGVKVTRINQDGLDIEDSLKGQQVNLGPQSSFDGSHGAGDGFEPIQEFSFHIGNNGDYISAEAKDPPKGTGGVVISPELQQELEIDDMNKWKKRRIDSLNSIIYTPGSNEDIIRKERIEKILLTGLVGGVRNAVLRYSVRYSSVMEKNLHFEPRDSKLVEKLRH